MKMKVVLMDNRISFNTFLRTDVLWSRFPKSLLINKAASSRLRFRNPTRFPKTRKKLFSQEKPRIHYRLGIKISIKISEMNFSSATENLLIPLRNVFSPKFNGNDFEKIIRQKSFTFIFEEVEKSETKIYLKIIEIEEFCSSADKRAPSTGGQTRNSA